MRQHRIEKASNAHKRPEKEREENPLSFKP
jgi:hypothetical protein